ncbi:type 1 glutamine amidotransferase [Oceanicola sp. 502str15]|uniref:type 1 glutamine amidotransferase n=1 Tax=Oceanicola sp. 502str15 TaxID=2696061 RepID=UPI0020960C26|nr:type 1 glutamine amidotransferase [Oceanicola sp. 502str15]MCO6382977.1 type 1 glutamine amidotransferase [Oceanicola sp. 502str15]
MLIGILQCGHCPPELQPHVGDYPAMFEKLLAGHGFDFANWAVCDMEFPNSIDAADGWLITGSRYGVYEDHPWIEPLEQIIRAIYLAPKPLVGICFGHQIIAQALGGKVEKSDKGWGVGRMEYTWGNEVVALNAWHQDQVIEPPKEASTISANKFCDHAALMYGDRVLSVQAHPEFGREMMQGLINVRGAAVPEARLAYAQKALDAPVDNARLGNDIADFFKAKREWQESPE